MAKHPPGTDVGGRPTRLTPELIEAMVADRDGPLPDKDVCIKHGVDPKLCVDWVKRGLRSSEEPFYTFAMQWCRAKIDRKEYLLGIVDQAMEKCRAGDDPKARGDYKAATWQLERSYPLEFGSMVAIKGFQDGNIDVDKLLLEVKAESDNLDALLLNPPAALIEAIRRNLDAVRSLLDEIAEEPALPAGT